MSGRPGGPHCIHYSINQANVNTQHVDVEPSLTPDVMWSQSVADKRLSGRFSCHFVKSVVSILIVM